MNNLRHRQAQRVTAQWMSFFVVLALVFFSASGVAAKVFASQRAALAEAFPDATRIDRETLLIRSADAKKIEAITHAKLKSRILVIHSAYQDDRLIGIAHIDVHNVRTKPEAFLVVLTPAGLVRSVRILAFHEPLDYLPTSRWYEQFAGKSKNDAFRVGRDIHGVVGATLSTRAAADGVRRMLAYWQVLLRTAEVDVQAP